MRDFKLFIKRILIWSLKLIRKDQELGYLPHKASDLKELTESYSTLYRKETLPVFRKMPLTIGKPHRKFIKLAQSPSWNIFVIVGKSWRVWGNQGAVITHDNCLLTDVSREFGAKTHSIEHQFKLIEPEYTQGRIAVLAASGSSVYYHWMFDILPRVYFLRESGFFDTIDKFIINCAHARFQEDTLASVGIPFSKIIYSNDHWNFHLKAEELIVPSLVSPNDCPSLEACTYLRQIYSLEIQQRRKSVRIYIKRQKGRKIVNESELLAFLNGFDFEVLEPENLSVSEQAVIFANAAIVIGAHGAGFTNIVFCHPSTLIIDLFSAEWMNPCYWIIAEHLQLQYGYLVGKTFKQAAKGKGADIMVDMNKLKNLFLKMDVYD